MKKLAAAQHFYLLASGAHADSGNAQQYDVTGAVEFDANGAQLLSAFSLTMATGSSATGTNIKLADSGGLGDFTLSGNNSQNVSWTSTEGGYFSRI
jgi:hypothetical protein